MRCTNPNGRYVDWQWSPFWRVDLWGYIRSDLRFAQVPLCLYRASGFDPSCSRGESFRPGNRRGITDTRDSPVPPTRPYAHTPTRCLLAPRTPSTPAFSICYWLSAIGYSPMTRIPLTDLNVFPLSLGGNVFGWTANE